MAGYAFQIGYAVVEVDGVKRLKFDDEREYRREDFTVEEMTELIEWALRLGAGPSGDHPVAPG